MKQALATSSRQTGRLAAHFITSAFIASGVSKPLKKLGVRPCASAYAQRVNSVSSFAAMRTAWLWYHK